VVVVALLIWVLVLLVALAVVAQEAALVAQERLIKDLQEQHLAHSLVVVEEVLVLLALRVAQISVAMAAQGWPHQLPAHRLHVAAAVEVTGIKRLVGLVGLVVVVMVVITMVLLKCLERMELLIQAVAVGVIILQVN
jgi:hypothetical protein